MSKTLKLLGAVFAVILLALAALFIFAAPSSATEQPTSKVYWAMPDGGTPDNVTWPQGYSPDGAVECGVWYQVDRYNDADIPALIADGLLYNGEDHEVVLDWDFAYGGDCEPAVEIVTPHSPTFEQECNGVYHVGIPDDTATHIYESNLVENFATVTATAKDGFAFPEGTSFTWEHEFTFEACPVVNPPEENPPAPPVDNNPPVLDDASPVLETLPETGGADWMLLPIGIALMVAGFGAWVFSEKRLRNRVTK